jgi:hypothetical protein
MVAKLRPAASRNNPEKSMSDEPGAVSAAGAGACAGASPGAAPKNPAADGDAGACFEAPLRGAPQHEGGGADVASAGDGGDDPVKPAPARRRRRGKPLPDLDWAEVRLDYEAGELTIPQVCEKYGLKRSQLRRVQEQGGWVKRPRIGVALVRASNNGPVERLAWRLRRSICAQLVRLDARRGGGEVEADARALSELIRGWSFLAMSDRKARQDQDKAGHNKKNNDAGPDHAADPEWRRAELKRRLVRLHGAGRLGERASEADG